MPAIIKYLGSAGMAALGVAGLMQTNFFNISVACIYIAIVFFTLVLWFEPWIAGQWWKRTIVILIMLPLFYLFTFRFVFIPGPLNVQVNGGLQDYAPNTFVAGIKWENYYSDVRIYLTNPTDRDYYDIDILLTTDLTIMAIGQITNVQNVLIMPFKPGIPEYYESYLDNTGKIAHKLLTDIKFISATTYRVRCSVLPKKSQLGLVGAIVVLNIPNNIDPRNTIIDPYTVFGEKRLPKWVQISARYRDFGRERKTNIRSELQD
jgi:hypothetical protein